MRWIDRHSRLSFLGASVAPTDDTTRHDTTRRQARPDDGLICNTCSGTGKVPCFNCKVGALGVEGSSGVRHLWAWKDRGSWDVCGG